MNKPLNGWTRTLLAWIALTGFVVAGASAHFMATGRIARLEDANLGQRLRHVEFVVVRMATELGTDISGFK